MNEICTVTYAVLASFTLPRTYKFALFFLSSRNLVPAISRPINTKKATGFHLSLLIYAVILNKQNLVTRNFAPRKLILTLRIS